MEFSDQEHVPTFEIELSDSEDECQTDVFHARLANGASPEIARRKIAGSRRVAQSAVQQVQVQHAGGFATLTTSNSTAAGVAHGAAPNFSVVSVSVSVSMPDASKRKVMNMNMNMNVSNANSSNASSASTKTAVMHNTNVMAQTPKLSILQSITAGPAHRQTSFEELRVDCYRQCEVTGRVRPPPVNAAVDPWAVIPPNFNAFLDETPFDVYDITMED